MVAPSRRRQLRVDSSRLGRDSGDGGPRRPYRPQMGGLPQPLGGVGPVDDQQSGPSQETLNIQQLLNPGFQPGATPRQLAEARMRRGDRLPGNRIDPSFQERDRRASAAARATRTDTNRNAAFHPPVEQAPSFRSFADYLREAEALIGGMGVNYDPQRNALRQNAAQANDILGSIYADLQQQFVNAAPQIAQRYAQAGENVDLNTAQAANAVNSSNTAIRDEQTRQLQALGIEDAVANVAPQQAADQANALQAIQQTGQIAGNQSDALGTAAATYNDENKGTAGMEGASKRALIQANLLSALANVDTRESEANSSLANQRQNSALSVAQLLMENDPEGANAAAAQARQMAELAQQQFDNEMAVRTFDAKYGQPRQQSGFGLQQVLDLLAQQGLSPDKTDPKTYAALLNAYSRFQ